MMVCGIVAFLAGQDAGWYDYGWNKAEKSAEKYPIKREEPVT